MEFLILFLLKWYKHTSSKQQEVYSCLSRSIEGEQSMNH